MSRKNDPDSAMFGPLESGLRDNLLATAGALQVSRSAVGALLRARLMARAIQPSSAAAAAALRSPTAILSFFFLATRFAAKGEARERASTPYYGY